MQNRYLKYPFLIVAFAAILGSCVSSVEIPCNDFEAEVVIFSVFSPDSTWNVLINQSKCRFEDSDDLTIPNVEVSIKNISASPNYNVNLENLGKGVYRVKSKAIPGNTYRISVVAQLNDEIVFAESLGKVPSVPETIVEVTEYLNDAGMQYYEIDFKLKSKEEDENYYLMNLVELNDQGEIIVDTLGNGGSNGGSTPFDYDSEVTFRNGSDGFNLEFIDKDDFSGGEYNNTITTPAREDEEGEGGFDGKRYAMNVQSVSGDLFQYYKSIEKYNSHQGPGSSISVPLEIHSNIKNGLGIFGAYNQTLHHIKP